MTKTEEKHNTQESQETSPFPAGDHKAAKNTLQSQEVSPFPVGDHKAARNRKDSETKTNMKHKMTKRINKRAPPLYGQ